jgi:hypothetical protein
MVGNNFPKLIVMKSRLFIPLFEKEGAGGDLSNKSPSIPL